MEDVIKERYLNTDLKDPLAVSEAIAFINSQKQTEAAEPYLKALQVCIKNGGAAERAEKCLKGRGVRQFILWLLAAAGLFTVFGVCAIAADEGEPSVLVSILTNVLFWGGSICTLLSSVCVINWFKGKKELLLLTVDGKYLHRSLLDNPEHASESEKERFAKLINEKNRTGYLMGCGCLSLPIILCLVLSFCAVIGVVIGDDTPSAASPAAESASSSASEPAKSAPSAETEWKASEPAAVAESEEAASSAEAGGEKFSSPAASEPEKTDCSAETESQASEPAAAAESEEDASSAKAEGEEFAPPAASEPTKPDPSAETESQASGSSDAAEPESLGASAENVVDPEAQFNIAGSYYKRGEYEKAAEWLRKAAEQGYAPAQFNLATCYYHGEGVKRSRDEAMKWLERSAKQGYAPAKELLISERAELLIANAKGGNVEAQYELGMLLYKEAAGKDTALEDLSKADFKAVALGWDPKFKEALKWLRKAAIGGHSKASFVYGVYLYRIADYEWDKNKKDEALSAAAEAFARSDEPKAKYYLARCTVRGWFK